LLINYVKLTTTEANITNYCHIGIAKHLSAQQKPVLMFVHAYHA
jgi:hypothetical protein